MEKRKEGEWRSAAASSRLGTYGWSSSAPHLSRLQMPADSSATIAGIQLSKRSDRSVKATRPPCGANDAYTTWKEMRWDEMRWNEMG